MKTFHLLAGLPRSGTTILSSILQQNPDVHSSQNSCLIDLLYHTNKLFHEVEQAKAFKVDNQIQNTLYFMAHGFYSHTPKKVIIDKSRAWPQNYDIAQIAFTKNKPKIICMVRSIPDILASFVKLAEDNPYTNYIDGVIKRSGGDVTNENRCEYLISGGGTLYECWAALKHGYTNYNENMIIVEYDYLCKHPKATLNTIYDFLDLPQYNHDLSNIINHTPEDDTVYGIEGMHSIRKELTPSPNNALDILGETLYNRYKGGEFWRT